jgi:hypothetical protein
LPNRWFCREPQLVSERRVLCWVSIISTKGGARNNDLPSPRQESESSIERLTHAAREHLRCERLLQKGCALGETAVAAATDGRSELGARSDVVGRQILKVEPRPGSLSTRMSPPLCLTIPSTVASPRPCPCRSPSS